MRITKHAKQRIKERNENVSSIAMAERNAKIAFRSGLTIGCVDKFSETLAEYMRNKKRRNGSNATIRIYQNNVYVWRGDNHRLVTVHPIPNIFKEEAEKVFRFEKEYKEGVKNECY